MTDASNIRVYIKFDTEEVMLPVNPDSIKVTQQGNNRTVNIIDYGETSIVQKPKLKEYSFNGFFPYESYYSWVLTDRGHYRPEQYLKLIEDSRNQQKTLRLIITGLNYDDFVTILKFETTQKAGEEFDVYYSIVLQEFKDPVTLVYPPKKKVAKAPFKDSDNKDITVGDKDKQSPEPNTKITPKEPVIGATGTFTGTYFYTSYGRRPTGSRTNIKVRINHLNNKPNVPYPVHIESIDGRWQFGWTLPSRIEFD